MRLQYVLSGIGVLGALGAGAGVYVTLHQGQKQVPVIVAAHDIPIYHKITRDDLKVVFVSPTDVVPDGTTSVKDIMGHMTSMTIPANTQIQKHEVSPAQSYQQVLAELDNKTQNLVMLNLPGNIDGIVSILKPGDQVILETPATEVRDDVTVLSAPTTTENNGSSTTSGPFLLALPLAEYQQIKNQLGSIKILAKSANDPYSSTPSPQSGPTSETQPGSATGTTTTTGVPQYFSPPPTTGGQGNAGSH